MRYQRLVLFLNQDTDAQNAHVADVYCYGVSDDGPTFSLRFNGLKMGGFDVAPLETVEREQVVEVSGVTLTDADVYTQQTSSAAEPADVYRLVIDPRDDIELPTFPIEQI